MVKNFFIDFFEIFKFSGGLFKETFKKQGLIIWALIVLQIMLAIPLSYFYKTQGFMSLAVAHKVYFVIGAIVCLCAFFFMFKKVFDVASVGFKNEKISYLRTLYALLVTGVLNCLPLLVFILMFELAKLAPSATIVFKSLLNIFSYLFYFALSLSLASISKWNKDNVFVAIWKSIKVFFQKIGLVILTFAIYFILGKILTFIICTIFYAFTLYYNILDTVLVNTIQLVVNLYSLYLITGLYIGSQVKILGIENEQSENNINEEQ